MTLYQPNQKNKKWARKFDQCLSCGTTTHPHGGHGYCINCYYKTPWGKTNRQKYLKSPKYKTWDLTNRPRKPIQRFTWSIHYPACILCGGTSIKHAGRGLCRSCKTKMNRAYLKKYYQTEKFKEAHRLRERNRGIKKMGAEK